MRRALDTYCGPGGITRGYQQAGFHVTGVDITPQPYYCGDEFIQADALDVLTDHDFLAQFDFIHASPTCQHHANVTAWRGSRESHPDTLTPTLRLLAAVSIPWVVENVPEACPPLRGDLLLCGSQFGLDIKRHRAFQLGNWSIPYGLMPPCDCGRARPFMHKDERAYADAMGCTWMSKEAARQAIPPPYSKWIGDHLMTVLEAAA